MNSAASFSTPPEEEGPCGDWTYHEWAEAFSTNDLARSLPPGHIAVCRVQTGGRGRFNRKWIGEEGGLWASFTVPLSAPEDTAAGVHWGHLPLVAGLALFNMLRGMGLDSVRLRWPNDLLAGKSKLAGILVERPAENMAVIGIGKLLVLSVHFKPGDGLFLLRNINHYQLNGNAHLGSRQANALCCVHGFQHILRQGFQAVVKMFYRAAFFLQYRISILCYFQ